MLALNQYNRLSVLEYSIIDFLAFTLYDVAIRFGDDLSRVEYVISKCVYK